MLAHRRRSDCGGRRVFAAFLVAVASGLFLGGCQSGPFLAFQGARHYAVGSEALEQGEGERAIAELRTASRFVPHGSEIQNHLGLAYWSTGRVDLARVAFERAVELDCDNRSARNNLERVIRAPEEGPFAVNRAHDAKDDPVRIRGTHGGDLDGG